LGAGGDLSDDAEDRNTIALDVQNQAVSGANAETHELSSSLAATSLAEGGHLQGPNPFLTAASASASSAVVPVKTTDDRRDVATATGAFALLAKQRATSSFKKNAPTHQDPASRNHNTPVVPPTAASAPKPLAQLGSSSQAVTIDGIDHRDLFPGAPLGEGNDSLNLSAMSIGYQIIEPFASNSNILPKHLLHSLYSNSNSLNASSLHRHFHRDAPFPNVSTYLPLSTAGELPQTNMDLSSIGNPPTSNDTFAQAYMQINAPGSSNPTRRGILVADPVLGSHPVALSPIRGGTYNATQGNHADAATGNDGFSPANGVAPRVYALGPPSGGNRASSNSPSATPAAAVLHPAPTSSTPRAASTTPLAQATPHQQTTSSVEATSQQQAQQQQAQHPGQPNQSPLHGQGFSPAQPQQQLGQPNALHEPSRNPRVSPVANRAVGKSNARTRDLAAPLSPQQHHQEALLIRASTSPSTPAGVRVKKERISGALDESGSESEDVLEFSPAAAQPLSAAEQKHSSITMQNNGFGSDDDPRDFDSPRHNGSQGTNDSPPANFHSPKKAIASPSDGHRPAMASPNSSPSPSGFGRVRIGVPQEPPTHIDATDDGLSALGLGKSRKREAWSSKATTIDAMYGTQAQVAHSREAYGAEQGMAPNASASMRLNPPFKIRVDPFMKTAGSQDTAAGVGTQPASNTAHAGREYKPYNQYQMDKTDFGLGQNTAHAPGMLPTHMNEAFGSEPQYKNGAAQPSITSPPSHYQSQIYTGHPHQPHPYMTRTTPVQYPYGTYYPPTSLSEFAPPTEPLTYAPVHEHTAAYPQTNMGTSSAMASEYPTSIPVGSHMQNIYYDDGYTDTGMRPFAQHHMPSDGMGSPPHTSHHREDHGGYPTYEARTYAGAHHVVIPAQYAATGGADVIGGPISVMPYHNNTVSTYPVTAAPSPIAQAGFYQAKPVYNTSTVQYVDPSNHGFVLTSDASTQNTSYQYSNPMRASNPAIVTDTAATGYDDRSTPTGRDLQMDAKPGRGRSTRLSKQQATAAAASSSGSAPVTTGGPVWHQQQLGVYHHDHHDAGGDLDEEEDDDEDDEPAPSEDIKRRSKLPFQAVLGLRKWFKQSLALPYPNKMQKIEMAQKLGLSPKQVHNWFSNTRKRIYAPWLRQIGIILVPFRPMSEEDEKKMREAIKHAREEEYMGPL